MEEAKVERRSFLRYPANVPIEFAVFNSQEPIAGETTDISSKGLGFFSKTNLPLRTILDIQFNMPDNHEEVQITGQIAWSEEVSPEKFRLGVSLKDTDLNPISIIFRNIQLKARHYSEKCKRPRISPA